MRCYQCLILAPIFLFLDDSVIARVGRSANKILHDPGTYVVHFEGNATDAELYHFAKQIIRRSNKKVAK